MSALPKAGLCNKLTVWARGLVFAELNGCTHYTYGWSQLSLRRVLRGEKSKRLYLRELQRDRFINYLRARVRVALSNKLICDPMVEEVALVKGATYLFHILNHEHARPADPFYDLSQRRDLIQSRLLERLSTDSKAALANTPAPMIGIHVRRGDFANFDWLQPIKVYRDMLQGVRRVVGSDVPALVFTDGTSDEVRALLEMSGVSLAPPNPDVVDMLLLSRSKVLITSRASTYSNWAAFLSDGVVLRDTKFSIRSRRPAELDAKCYEGLVSGAPETWPELARTSIREVLARA